MPQSMQRAPCFWSRSVGHGSMTCRQSRTRSSTGRYGCLSRLNSMKPVTLPIPGLPVRARHHRVVHRHARLLRLLDGHEHTLVVLGYDLDEALARALPVDEEARGHRALGVANVAREEILHELHVLYVHQGLEVHHAEVAAALEVARLVEHVGQTARHARGEVAAGAADHHHAAARHVLAAVVAHALHHRGGAAVTHGEALAGDPAEVGLAAGGPVEHHVADEDVLLGH